MLFTFCFTYQGKFTKSISFFFSRRAILLASKNSFNNFFFDHRKRLLQQSLLFAEAISSIFQLKKKEAGVQSLDKI